MLTQNDMGKGGVKNNQKVADVINEQPLTRLQAKKKESKENLGMSVIKFIKFRYDWTSPLVGPCLVFTRFYKVNDNLHVNTFDVYKPHIAVTMLKDYPQFRQELYFIDFFCKNDCFVGIPITPQTRAVQNTWRINLQVVAIFLKWMKSCIVPLIFNSHLTNNKPNCAIITVPVIFI